jgi:hypothetical protein
MKIIRGYSAARRRNDLLDQRKRRITLAVLDAVNRPTGNAAFIPKVLLGEICGKAGADECGSFHDGKVSAKQTRMSSAKLARSITPVLRPPAMV